MSSIPLIIGHRGAAYLAPENTLEAFALAWQEGADGVEADFRLTLDKRIVAMHDATTLRTTGIRLRVAKTPLASLSLLDAGSGRGKELPGLRIPTLADILHALPNGKRLYIELKSGVEIIPPLLRLLAEAEPPPEQIRILAFNADLLRELKQSNPLYRTCWLTDFRQIFPRSRHAQVENIIETLKSCAANGLAGKAGPMIDAELVGMLRQMGREIHVWTVDSSAAGRRFASLGVDSIITNRPGWLRERLGYGS